MMHHEPFLGFVFLKKPRAINVYICPSFCVSEIYTLNSKLKGWWEDVRFVVWGPSAKLLSVDVELQEYLQKMRDAGVTLEACKKCSDLFGVSAKLEDLGIDVKYMGVPLTTYLKEGRNIITF